MPLTRSQRNATSGSVGAADQEQLLAGAADHELLAGAVAHVAVQAPVVRHARSVRDQGDSLHANHGGRRHADDDRGGRRGVGRGRRNAAPRPGTVNDVVPGPEQGLRLPNTGHGAHGSGDTVGSRGQAGRGGRRGVGRGGSRQVRGVRGRVDSVEDMQSSFLVCDTIIY